MIFDAFAFALLDQHNSMSIMSVRRVRAKGETTVVTFRPPDHPARYVFLALFFFSKLLTTTPCVFVSKGHEIQSGVKQTKQTKEILGKGYVVSYPNPHDKTISTHSKA